MLYHWHVQAVLCRPVLYYTANGYLLPTIRSSIKSRSIVNNTWSRIASGGNTRSSPDGSGDGGQEGQQTLTGRPVPDRHERAPANRGISPHTHFGAYFPSFAEWFTSCPRSRYGTYTVETQRIGTVLSIVEEAPAFYPIYSRPLLTTPGCAVRGNLELLFLCRLTHALRLEDGCRCNVRNGTQQSTKRSIMRNSALVT